jgi:hypothetical protein
MSSTRRTIAGLRRAGGVTGDRRADAGAPAAAGPRLGRRYRVRVGPVTVRSTDVIGNIR